MRQTVLLSEAPDAVHATVTTLTQNGFTSARLSLSPESLGGVRVNLTQTSNGIIATVVADHPEAAGALQAQANELRRSLQDSGVQLLRLDIGSSGQQNFGGASGSGQQSSAQNPRRLPAPSPADTGGEAPSTISQMTITLAGGSLIDVLV